MVSACLRSKLWFFTYNYYSNIFSVGNVKPYVEQSIKLFASEEYESSRAANDIMRMCDQVRENLKHFNYKRYRYIVSGELLTIGLFIALLL